jgi:sialate O-acetylesterase
MPAPSIFLSAISARLRPLFRVLPGVSLALLASSQVAVAEVRLPQIFADNMVLQRDQPLTIYGWADEGEAVSVRFADQTASTTAKGGRWQVTLKPIAAGGPFTLEVNGVNRELRENILTGDVWIAAGQSNMELPLRRVAPEYPGLIENTNLPTIRQFALPLSFSTEGPQADYSAGNWAAAVPENLPEFAATGFFFARALQQQTNVPVGIVSIAVGGSPAEAWVSEPVLQGYPHYVEQLKPFRDQQHLESVRAQDKANSDRWYATLNAADIGLKQQWFKPETDDKAWSTLTVPGRFHEQNIDFELGSMWLRKTIQLTTAQAAKPATAWLGSIVHGDEVYVNGTSIGQTGYQYPPRIYKVPAGLLKAGDNNITIRLTSYAPNPGFVADKRYELDLGDEALPLDGSWRYRVATTAEPMTPSTTLHYLPSSLYNARLAPLLPMAVKGVIWYQGESNVSRDKRIPAGAPALIKTDQGYSVPETGEYRALFGDLINDWRNAFKREDLPFVFVQLANYLEPKAEPGESEWADLREATRQTLALPHTAMAVIIDVGEWNDIHPLDKQSVGERLALGARKVAYGESNLLASGPTLKALQRKGDSLVLTFDNTGKGLKVKGKKAQEFAIAGEDGKFVWAEAKVKGDRITLSAKGVKQPSQVRYAWADNPDKANLYNSAGLPASPFQAVVNP